ncbi:qNor nitric-oxide reductase [Candidatus Scalindua japonica]|uniref:QNor nitric-oxide reductase n=2 Tax=Candidatus Scalindua japonica TaxID=1284222 RepID=A0A286U3X6_9BACT|nr:qNor nitric-oxide reductase [Candidatus Scalindua japonica]
MGFSTYKDAPPKPDYISPEGVEIVQKSAVERGQLVFQKYALMEYGSMFGDGAARGPDFTAEALHRIAVDMNNYYGRQVTDGNLSELSQIEKDGISVQVRRELKENRYDMERNIVVLTEGYAYAAEQLVDYYRLKFKGNHKEAFKPAGYITDDSELNDLSAFFFWGAWVCAAERPGGESSYTHNWPFDEYAGNVPTPSVILWSVIGMLFLIFGLGAVLCTYSYYSKASQLQVKENPVNNKSVEASIPTATQRAAYKFFVVAVALLFIQIVAGVLTIHDFVGFTTFFGYNISEFLQITITRSWHVQLSILWIATCWIAGSIFLLPGIHRQEPNRQVLLINVLFGLLVSVVVGMLVGCFLGPKNLLGDNWRLFGNQGWEFVELGKVWQIVLFAALIMWAVIIYRGVKPALKGQSAFSLPYWILYSVVAITILFLSSFVGGKNTNFVIADFWRWCVIHMWAECFFEVFTTIVIACYMVFMGLVSRQGATRVIYLATLLFLGSGLLGISHNFYWNAKPAALMAIGSVFSTLQVIPLVLLTLEVWKFVRIPGYSIRRSEDSAVTGSSFGFSEAFLFLIAVNFWNFFGAGVFGLIINLPIINYYEHGTYLTVNHGHAALMGVYGNLSIAAVLFCSRHVITSRRWNVRLLRSTFWAINVGLLLMVLMDTFPAGVLQFRSVVENGYWVARSQEFILGGAFQVLTWMRAVGGVLFFAGVIPLLYFMVSRLNSLKAAATTQKSEEPVLITEELPERDVQVA